MIPKNLKKYIAPALLVYSKKESAKKLSFIYEHYPSSFVHVDVMDGIFVHATCWCKPRDFRNLRIKQSLEAHLMTFNPERRVAAWKRAGATRIIFHYEATNNPLRVIHAIKKQGLQVIIALNPKTSAGKIALLVDKVDGILFMGVNPGWAGQKFQRTVFKKIKISSALYPRKLIIIDGGVTSKNAPLLIRAGARQLVSTSAIYGSENYARE